VKFSLAVSTHATHFEAVAFQGQAPDRLRQLARLGYDGVELAVRDPAQLDVDTLQAALAETKLVVPAIATGQAWVDEKLSFTSADAAVRAAAIERFHAHLDLAARLKAIAIVGLIRGATPPGAGHAQAMTWLVEALRECAATARALGVELVVEPINRYETDLVNTIGEALALLDWVAADNVGLLPDTFHMNIEESSIEASLRQAGTRIRHFHAADSNRRYPGAGHLDFKRILAALQDSGYRRWVSVEIEPEPEPALSAERALATLRACLPPATSADLSQRH
jgi:sugar phosphate isomerase/epimerase